MPYLDVQGFGPVEQWSTPQTSGASHSAFLCLSLCQECSPRLPTSFLFPMDLALICKGLPGARSLTHKAALWLGLCLIHFEQHESKVLDDAAAASTIRQAIGEELRFELNSSQTLKPSLPSTPWCFRLAPECLSWRGPPWPLPLGYVPELALTGLWESIPKSSGFCKLVAKYSNY